MIQLTVTLEMTNAQVVETSVTSTTTVLFRTTFTWTIILNRLFAQKCISTSCTTTYELSNDDFLNFQIECSYLTYLLFCRRRKAHHAECHHHLPSTSDTSCWLVMNETFVPLSNFLCLNVNIELSWTFKVQRLNPHTMALFYLHVKVT